MQEKRPTQKHIAALAGVATSTVCLALQNHPSIPKGTRDKIRRIAEQIGYRPDPMLSSLAAYRTALRPPAFHGQLAWLSASKLNYKWRQVPVYVNYMRGASAQAARHGYTLTDYDLNDPGMTPARLAGIFRARNIRGILVCPQPSAHAVIDFAWANFAAVTLGYTLDSPVLHLVTANHYHSTRLIFHKLAGFGYQRIGFAVPNELNERVGGHFLAAYLVEQQKLPFRRRLPPYVDPAPTKAKFAAWLRRTKPDALITTNYLFPDYLADLKVKVPDDLGVVVLFKRIAGDNFAGIDQNSYLTGQIAMDYLVAMIQRNETGVPDTAQRILVEGKWVMGSSVRQIGSPAFT